MRANEKAARAANTSGRNGSAGANRLHGDDTRPGCGCQEENVPIHRADGRVIGQVRSGVFRKRIKGSRHLLRRPPAIAFDLESLVGAENAGAGVVRIEDVEDGRVYAATMGDIRRRGFLLNRGHGDQWAVPLPVWSVTGGNRGISVQLALTGVRP